MPSVPSIPVSAKRVIVEHLAGPYVGLRQILGVFEPTQGSYVPMFVPGVLLVGNRRSYGIEFTGASEFALRYQEVLPPETVPAPEEVPHVQG